MAVANNTLSTEASLFVRRLFVCRLIKYCREQLAVVNHWLVLVIVVTCWLVVVGVAVIVHHGTAMNRVFFNYDHS